MHKAARSVRSPNRYGQVQTQLPERAPSLVMGVPEPQTNMPVVEKFGQLVRATTYLFNPANVPLVRPSPHIPITCGRVEFQTSAATRLKSPAGLWCLISDDRRAT